MIKAAVLLSLVALGSANLILANNGYDNNGWAGNGRVLVDSYSRPTPFSFGYDTQDEYGTQQTRQESGDGSGSVRGSYSLRDARGIARVVEYVADAGGFRANVKTNEPGTASSDPADVRMNSNPITVDQPRLLLTRPSLVSQQLVSQPYLNQGQLLNQGVVLNNGGLGLSRW